jgi:hypothetical protein
VRDNSLALSFLRNVAWQQIKADGSTESTSSTSYTDLTTAGPEVTVTTAEKALVIVSAFFDTTAASRDAFMSYAVSGATTIAVTDTVAARLLSSAGGRTFGRMTRVSLLTSLTPGSNTFTAKYKAAGGSVSFDSRDLIVIPLPE